MNVKLVDVGPDDGERQIVVESPNGARFGVFDGYKDGEDGIARPATPDWMEGKTVEAVLLATIGGEIDSAAGRAPSITPNQTDPTDSHDHQFVGSFLPRGESTAPLSAVHLYDGVEPSDAGVSLTRESASLTAFSVGSGNILVNMNDLDHSDVDRDRSDTYRVSAARTDVLGYRLTE